MATLVLWERDALGPATMRGGPEGLGDSAFTSSSSQIRG